MAGGNNVYTERFLRTTLISGDIHELNTTAGGAADNTTIARYNVGGLTTFRRFDPLAVTTANNGPPPDTPQGQGWRQNTAQHATERIRTNDADWVFRFRGRRSGQALEVDQQATIVFALYRMNASGAFQEFIGSASLTGFVFTTTVQTGTVTLPTPGEFLFQAGDLVQVEVYVQTTAAGLPTAPAVATDLWCTINESSANGAKLNPPNYTIENVRAVSAIMKGVASFARRLTLKRTMGARMAGVASLARRLSLRRSFNATMKGVASRPILKVKKPLNATMLGRASMDRRLALKRTMTATMKGLASLTRRLSLHRTFSATMKGVASVARAFRGRRTFDATMKGRATAFIKLPFGKVPGGAATIIRKIFHVSDE